MKLNDGFGAISGRNIKMSLFLMVLALHLIIACSDSGGGNGVNTDGDTDDESESSEMEGASDCPQVSVYPNALDFDATSTALDSSRRMRFEATEAHRIYSFMIDQDIDNEFSIRHLDCSVSETGEPCHYFDINQAITPETPFELVVEYLPKDAMLNDNAVLIAETSDPCQPQKRINLSSLCIGAYDLQLLTDNEEQLYHGDTLDLPFKNPGQAGASVALTVKNMGAEATNALLNVHFETDTLFQENFRWQDCLTEEIETSGFFLGVGEEKTCTALARTQTVQGEYTGKVAVLWDSGCEGNDPPIEVNLKAQVGSCAVDVTPTEGFDYGQVFANSGVEEERSFRIENTCPYPMQWTTCELAKGVDFIAQCPNEDNLSLSAGEVRSLAVLFSPMVIGEVTDTLMLGFRRNAEETEQMRERPVMGEGVDCVYPQCCPQDSDFCVPDTFQCLANAEHQICNDACSWETDETCSGGAVCIEGRGCVVPECEEDEFRCEGDMVYLCENEIWVEGYTCDDENECTIDTCTDNPLDQDHCTYEDVENGTPCDDGNPDTEETVCRMGECSDSECVCGGVNACCDGCFPINDGGACEAGNLCLSGDSCVEGVCAEGEEAVECTPISQCHQAGECLPVTGECTNPTKPDGAECDDGDPLTYDDECTGGECSGADCVCTEVNTCCDGCLPTNEGGSCDDSNLCTQSDVCRNGVCNGENPIVCEPFNQCFEAGECDPDTGVCSDPLKPNGIPCDDRNPNTINDTCQNGYCMGEGCECNSPDAECCDGCHPIRENLSCDDSNACTTRDRCREGVCVGMIPVVCEAQSQCHQVGECLPTTGFCTHPEKPDGTTCSDDTVCTVDDLCYDGVCVSGETMDCDDNNPCTFDSCDPDEGCRHRPIDGDLCDDGDACTRNDICVAGECTPGEAVTCNDAKNCTNDICDPDVGCVFTPDIGRPCDDGNACTNSDACNAEGYCAGQEEVVCEDDDNVCTEPYCDSVDGCLFRDIAGDCDDNDTCTIGDFCSNGTCQGGFQTLECDDENACTTDSCDPITGCVFDDVPNGTECTDDNRCTNGDTCQAGVCEPGAAVDCNDDDQCTLDECGPAWGCTNVFQTDANCDDGFTCTIDDLCDDGQRICKGVKTDSLCDDSDPCTDDECEPTHEDAEAGTGCIYVDNGSCK